MPPRKRSTKEDEPIIEEAQPEESFQNAHPKRNLLAALCYLGPLFVVPMFIGHKDTFLKFHMRQGFSLFLVGTIASFCVYIPLIGWFIPASLIFVAIYAAKQALEGKTWRIPHISSFADSVEL
jgi:uncharacterized membrane protein